MAKILHLFGLKTAPFFNRQTDKQTDRDRERHTHKDTGRDRDGERETDRQRQTEKQRERERERERENNLKCKANIRFLDSCLSHVRHYETTIWYITDLKGHMFEADMETVRCQVSGLSVCCFSCCASCGCHKRGEHTAV